MSRYHPKWDIDPILNAANHWRDKALIGKGSVFLEKSIWTDENLSALVKHFIENPILGKEKFIEKLERQLEPTSSEVKQLAAEMYWLMMLCPSSITLEHKKAQILTIWSWSGQPEPPTEPWLADSVLRGIGSGGPGYNQHQPSELEFLINFVRIFRAEKSNRQRELLEDGWKLAEWFEKVPEAESRQLRHMMLYLLFPDIFERIFGRRDRLILLEALTDNTRAQVGRMSALEVCEEIRAVRLAQEKIYPDQLLDFYEPPLMEQWGKKRKPDRGPPVADPFDEQTSGVRRKHVLDALAEIDRDGWPDNARSSTYDLIYGDKRYPPKYVLSLACRYSAGEEFARQFFEGGRESKAFRLLQSLGFHIELKSFLPELIKKFIEQADDGVNLAVSEYPNEYRGLQVKVSFGKGNFARVPWITFTGYEQTTQDGIYPGVLYYKSLGYLLVTYGLSETNRPKLEWQNLGDAPTITAYLEDALDKAPARYGKSYVVQGFDLSDGLDERSVEAAIDRVIGTFHAQFESQGATPKIVTEVEPYGLTEAFADLFVEEEKLEEILYLIRNKKNVILQGPPGVGKTFVSKRLAYALMGEKAEDRVDMVQFHQSYAYEDFVQGYRPSGTGFKLKNGKFHVFCEKAKKDPARDYVFIIDEINRGNLSKVFGELMMLIESDKRGPKWGMPLTYAEETDSKFYVPENLYLIGLMNTADRSLAMVDYALRRRFAFADLVPGFDSDEFRQFLIDAEAEAKFVDELVIRMDEVNAKITADTTNLGRGYCIGHSFFCAVPEDSTPDWDWFNQIIRTEIAPLLREYYFDDEKQANALIDGLLRKP